MCTTEVTSEHNWKKNACTWTWFRSAQESHLPPHITSEPEIPPLLLPGGHICTNPGASLHQHDVRCWYKNLMLVHILGPPGTGREKKIGQHFQKTMESHFSWRGEWWSEECSTQLQFRKETERTNTFFPPCASCSPNKKFKPSKSWDYRNASRCNTSDLHQLFDTSIWCNQLCCFF